MSRKYTEYKELNLSKIALEVLHFWEKNKIFEQSISCRKDAPAFTFYEGPPSANGMPGIHHVMARTVKDIFCRFKTLQGYQVRRKGGWDAHGLPVELQTEKQLGITKEDIGETISIAEYNQKCRDTVMRYKNKWDELTLKMGYWVDLNRPYITYEKKYIETLWWIIKKLYQQELLYKGYSIQPYSPAAGTGLSSHELNLPGCYQDVKDISVVAQFKVKRDACTEFLFTGIANNDQELYALAWTTTPWTLPANSALAVGEKIKYLLVDTVNSYTKLPVTIILAKEVFYRYFHVKPNTKIEVGACSIPEKAPIGGKLNTWKILDEFDGKSLIGVRYDQIMPYVTPLYNAEKAFQIVAADFVTVEDGTGIVHISPTFGSDDFKVARLNAIPAITVEDEDRKSVPIVDKKGKFVKKIAEQLIKSIAQYGIKTHKRMELDDFYVKNYTGEDESNSAYKSVDAIISIILKEENKAFKVEKYTHSYPHCWRTHKPLLYYPLDSWFIKTTVLKNRMMELNRTINWKPASTGSGRFGHWLENLVDWNLSRSRYWGTPLPIWRTEDGKEEKCIGSLEELEEEVAQAVAKGIANPNIKSVDFDLHRPYVDEVILVSSEGKLMYREPDLLDVWFDSGAMPYAQWHYPFENKETFNENFPADYIAEGVDQTRGWFFTLHAIAVMLFDRVAFKNVISNGLVLDSKGNKMSKSKDNTVNPFDIIEKHGADAVRWYMIANAPPWENLKFDEEGIVEVKRRFFRALFNTYSFFALYANIDSFVKEEQHQITHRPPNPLDRWIISCLQSLVVEVEAAYNEYEPTKAARAIHKFVNDHLSNWYIRLSRKRFWQPTANSPVEMDEDKRIAYQTLYECLSTVICLMAPIAPFFAEWMYQNLLCANSSLERQKMGETDIPSSIHLTDFVKADNNKTDKNLEQTMEYAQQIASLVHSIRKKNKIKVRTPLNKVLLPIPDKKMAYGVQDLEELIKAEVNVKSIEYIDDTSEMLVKKAKPHYTKLGKQYGARMKEVAKVIHSFTSEEIKIIEQSPLSKNGFDFVPEDVVISHEDISGWSVASENGVTVALDIVVTGILQKEGIARDFVNRIQNLRKQIGLDVMDKIDIEVETKEKIVSSALSQFKEYIGTEIQALSLKIREEELSSAVDLNIDEHKLKVKIRAT